MTIWLHPRIGFVLKPVGVREAEVIGWLKTEAGQSFLSRLEDWGDSEVGSTEFKFTQASSRGPLTFSIPSSHWSFPISDGDVVPMASLMSASERERESDMEQALRISSPDAEPMFRAESRHPLRTRTELLGRAMDEFRSQIKRLPAPLRNSLDWVGPAEFFIIHS